LRQASAAGRLGNPGTSEAAFWRHWRRASRRPFAFVNAFYPTYKKVSIERKKDRQVERKTEICLWNVPLIPHKKRFRDKLARQRQTCKLKDNNLQANRKIEREKERKREREKEIKIGVFPGTYIKSGLFLRAAFATFD
jgi:hypothetical protein